VEINKPLCILRDIDTLSQLRKQLLVLPGILPVQGDHGDKIQMEIYAGDTGSYLKITKRKIDLTQEGVP
jgi:hypothetical protein